jgi:hypothetical protein
MKRHKTSDFLLNNREKILEAFTGSPGKAWERLVPWIHIDEAMSLNTFRVLIVPFVETCRFYEAKLQKTDSEAVKCRLNESDELGLNNPDEKLNNHDKQAKQPLNISGWTVTKSGSYYRAFKKIDGKLRGIHLGKTLENAAEKIAKKAGG